MGVVLSCFRPFVTSCVVCTGREKGGVTEARTGSGILLGIETETETGVEDGGDGSLAPEFVAGFWRVLVMPAWAVSQPFLLERDCPAILTRDRLAGQQQPSHTPPGSSSPPAQFALTRKHECVAAC